jgi:hypothetical protein
MSKPSIDLSICVYKFQKRLRWVLSSLNQQVNNPFDMTIRLATHSSDPYKAMHEEMVKTFPNLKIVINEYTDDSFNSRGLTRTNDIKACTSEWILFLDGDNVFHPTFFDKLYSALKDTTSEVRTQCISVPRLTMLAKTGYKLIDSVDTKEIANAYNEALSVKTHLSFKGRVNAAGFFQLAHVPTMKQMGITSYVNGSHDTPVFDKGTRYSPKSDIVFRKKFTGIYAIRELPLLIHINHYRRTLDKEYNFDLCN